MSNIDMLRYRAWDKFSKQMLQVEVIDFSFNRVICNPDFWYIGDQLIEGSGTTLSFDEIELLQCSGLTDADGCLLYDGDIMYDDHYDECGKVIIDEGKFLYSASGVETDLGEVHDQLVLRGDIYRDPELLGGGEEADE